MLRPPIVTFSYLQKNRLNKVWQEDIPITNPLTVAEYKSIIKGRKFQKWYRGIVLNQEDISSLVHLLISKEIDDILISKKDGNIHFLLKTHIAQSTKFFRARGYRRVKRTKNFSKSLAYICKYSSHCISSDILLLNAMHMVVAHFKMKHRI